MADNQESLGTVGVNIRGDYSKLGADFDAAVAQAVAGGQTLAEAINSAMSSTTASSAVAAESISNIGTAAEVAGAQVQASLGESSAAGQSIVGTAILTRALGSEIGVGIPRALSSVVAAIGPVGAAIQAAFVPIIAVAFIEILVKVADKIGSVIDAIGGWDSKTREVYANISSQNEQLYQSYEKIAEQIDKISSIGLTGSSKYIAEEGNVEKAITRVNNELNIQRAALAQLEELSQRKLFSFGEMFSGEYDIIQDRVKQIPAVQANIQRLTETLRELSQVKGPTVAAETVAALAEEAKKAEDSFGPLVQKSVLLSAVFSQFQSQQSSLAKDVAAWQTAVHDADGSIKELAPSLTAAETGMEKFTKSGAEAEEVLKQLSDARNADALAAGRQLEADSKLLGLKQKDNIDAITAAHERLRVAVNQGLKDTEDWGRGTLNYYKDIMQAGGQLSTAEEVDFARISFSIQTAEEQGKFFLQTMNTVSRDIAAGLSGIIDGTMTVKDAFHRLALDILDDCLNIIVKQGLNAIINALSGPLGGIFGAIGGIIGGFFADGGDVPHDMIAVVHGGERVLNKKEADAYRSLMPISSGTFSSNTSNAYASNLSMASASYGPVNVTAHFVGSPRENAREFAKLLKVSAPHFTF